MTLRERDENLVELMDDPECDPVRLAATYRRFGLVNRLVSGWGGVYAQHLRPYLRGLGRPARVLDLGSGGGDLVDRLERLARRDGLQVTWVGADPDPRAQESAAAHRRPGIDFRLADAATLHSEGEVFDAVVSNHVLHHLDAASFDAFTRESLALSRGLVLHADIARGRLAWLLYGIGITPLAPGTFLRTDGLRSIRRSYRPAELVAALDGRWRVERPAPFRVLAIGRGTADA